MQDLEYVNTEPYTHYTGDEHLSFLMDLLRHDINNKNCMAILNLEVMLKDKMLPDAFKERLESVVRAVNESSRLLNAIKRLQNREFDFKGVSMDDVLTDMVSEYSKNPFKEVKIIYSQTSIRVIADELLKDVFSNLLDNAIKYSGERVSINISVKECENGFVRITIEDNGNGIPDALKEKVFEKHIRGSSEVSGTGLGLYLVKTLIECYGGRIWMEDRVLGDHTEGSRFILILPTCVN